MAGMCCGIVGGDSDPTPVEPAASRGVRRRSMEVRPQLKLVAAAAAAAAAATEIDPAVAPVPEIKPAKRLKLDLQGEHLLPAAPRKYINTNHSSGYNNCKLEKDEVICPPQATSEPVDECTAKDTVTNSPKFGATSVRGRRRDMEDAVSIRPSFCGGDGSNSSVASDFHFYGIFDGHGCSHVAMKCKARMHAIMKEEIEKETAAAGGSIEWKAVMERSFARMDVEVAAKPNNALLTTSCRCELQTPQCDAVGSTAVVAIVTPDKIVVGNCGDSRAVLFRKGVALPLSSDHKPDRPDELDRIQSAGGRVIYWDGARVLGVLAMSRAIGDNYLKPYVIPDPEVTVTERNGEEECLILASDGLWDVVKNETAGGVARMCLSAERPTLPPSEIGAVESDGSCTAADKEISSSDKACLDASLLLTRLALARHSADNISVVVADLRKAAGL